MRTLPTLAELGGPIDVPPESGPLVVDDAPRLRPELGVLPARMQRLPLDQRGFPIPWFVFRDEHGVADFRIMDRGKFHKAIAEHRCWVCSDVLGHHRVFVLSGMCGLNRTT